MPPRIVEAYSHRGVDVARIVKRVVKYAPRYSLEGLEEILILDKDPRNIGFASYHRKEKRIELYVSDIIGWQPWILRKSYIFPYMVVAMALGHEIDHHVRREADQADKEECAEGNVLRYVYPSFGIFKPVIWLLSAASGKSKIFLQSRRGS